LEGVKRRLGLVKTRKNQGKQEQVQTGKREEKDYIRPPLVEQIGGDKKR